MMASSSFLAPPLPLLSSLRQPQIHPRCASLCPSSLTAALPPPPGSPRCNSCCRCRCRCRSRPSLPIFCFSLSRHNIIASAFSPLIAKLIYSKYLTDGAFRWCGVDSRAAYASEEERNKKLLESYGLDPSDFLSRSVNEVLGGKACRKKLLSPKGMDVRPMMEVVKGAAFGILQVAGGCPASLRPGRWLDLYSGTGAVGIEAISRGCSENELRAHFVEMDPWVVSKVLQPNLESTGFSDVSVIHTVRVERFLEQAEQSLASFNGQLTKLYFADNNRTFDYVSVTPPYTEVDYSVLMDQLAKSPLVGEDCFILVEYPLKTSMADSCGHLIKIRDNILAAVGFSEVAGSWLASWFGHIGKGTRKAYDFFKGVGKIHQTLLKQNSQTPLL
ncbi:hypothetical protein ZIOFF_015532 [Zingiber officinale]|uniref:Uncharacterized protein n=1 Tax=Zingiber officinale TaxID=94328 RepID=A0A8J5LQC1_ZINOF|nr:hypothetical protein ZIOFF_015532 [Zingiber officinale]